MNNRLNMMSRRRSRVAREAKHFLDSKIKGVRIFDATGRKHVDAGRLPQGRYSIFVNFKDETGDKTFRIGVPNSGEATRITYNLICEPVARTVCVIPSRMRDYFNKVGGGSS